MELDINTQIMNFIKALLCGSLYFILYDMFRILRTFFKSNAVIVFIQDFLYMSFVFISTFIFVFAFNEGALRIYILCGILVGWLVSFATYGRFSRFVIKKCRKQQ